MTTRAGRAPTALQAEFPALPGARPAPAVTAPPAPPGPEAGGVSTAGELR
jgi:hypothetical protein